MAMRYLATLLLLSCVFVASCGNNPEAKLRVAVAANFRPALEVLRVDFERNCQCRLAISSGATGLLYSQIREGAPFDIFLAADSKRPALLQRAGEIVPGSRKNYARGQLALWISHALGAGGEKALPGFVPDAQLAPEQLARLLGNWRGKIVIADPQLAPYGDAAVQLLRKHKLWRKLRQQMVYAVNVGHAQILLLEGHAQVGLIPLSLATADGNRDDFMSIAADQYPPLEQQMVILKDARSPELARRFADYILSPQAQKRLGELGYLPV